MKKKVYIETSVVSYYTGGASRDVVIAGHQQSTHAFWSQLSQKLLPHVSALVVKESGKGDPEQAARRLAAIDTFAVLATTPDAEKLAREILDCGGVAKQYPEDALHIAVAAIAGMDFIATWNFTHINNPFTKMKIRHAVETSGYECQEIVSPDAFLEDEA